MKTVVITGTSKGLGFSLAKYFIDNDWKVIGISRQPCCLGENYTHIACDISKSNEVIRSINAIEKIDVLINNAAIFEMTDFISTDISSIDKIIDTNLKGSMYVTHQLIHHIKENGKIIFINSVAGLTDIKNQSVYCASKAGLKSFANVIAQELRPKKIKVSSIHPGGINTTLWNENNPYPGGNTQDILDPDLISKIIFFICSNTNVEFKDLTIFPEIEWH
jgi:short-subunit dehydrogenase